MNIDNFYKYECNLGKNLLFYGLFIISLLIICIFYLVNFLLN